jgi:hypothetical protein
MRRELQLELRVEPVPRSQHRSLRRCHGCGNYERPFVEMEGVIRCEKCAKKDESREDAEKTDMGAIDGFGMIT